MREMALGLAASFFFAITEQIETETGTVTVRRPIEKRALFISLFILLGVLSAPLPNGWALVGLTIIVVGICWHSFEAAKTVKRSSPSVPKTRHSYQVGKEP
ncbi:hypothetical protein RA955_11260 [Geobacillus proteiniphilus]|uniref:Putative membrane protein n=1 Tax=Geobacillus proteiniphilus TaxID=860353 RepID=A0A1Q5SZZ7_9BACL|nr:MULTISPECIES: hypothetical protein [Geobacillus]OKO93563.1 putative membrane protein [Geobacillus proteiniphilus]OPX01614.1 hypothetical protein B1A75_15710 [Geobacillus sp. LEMMY01]WMJ15385.1 hypothetical protein RA955_11260 [Geobacillus proteiniphilus]